MFFNSQSLLIPKMFQPYFSKKTGPPVIRMQIFGTPGRRFYRIVACNQKDPRDGKHIEVLGTYAPLVKDGVKEIRLRFSRVKFWLGVGAKLTKSTAEILGEAGLIPPPPPLHGGRNQIFSEQVSQSLEENEIVHAAAIEEMNKQGARKGVFNS